MGPAASWHSNTRQAQEITTVDADSCLFGGYAVPAGATLADGAKYGIPSTECEKTAWGSDATTATHTESCEARQWGDLTRVNPYDGKTYPWALTVCTARDSSRSRNWHQINPGAGVMYTRRYDDHSISYFGTLVRDSYGTSSVMAGASYMWPLATLGTISVDGGLAGGLWYRSVLNPDTNALSRSLVPYVFPGVSITETKTGLGVVAGVIPKMNLHFGGRRFSTPTTVMVQLTYLVKKTLSGSSSLSVQSSADGGMQATWKQTF